MAYIEAPRTEGGSDQNPNGAPSGEQTGSGASGMLPVGTAKAVNADLELTPEQLARINRGALRTLLRSVWVQGAVLIAVGLVAWMVGGSAAGVSALVGAAAYAIPNVLFALRLAVSAAGLGKVSAMTFFLGELLKLGATAALLALSVFLAQGALVWPALIIGLIVALKSQYWLLLFKNS